MTAMRLKVCTPTDILLEQDAAKIVAEAHDGFFCLLPRHIDFVAALVPGILYVTDLSGEASFVAVDEGTLVKRGPEVLVSVMNAATGAAPAALETTVREAFGLRDADAQRTRSALARLEAATMRRFLELEQQAHA